MKIGIIDYGAGNLQSVLNAFRALEADAHFITRAEELADITHLVLPGQGEFGDCAQKLDDAHMTQPIKQWITENKPFLGICVGYQLLFEGSEESPSAKGLGIFKGVNKKFKVEPSLKIPHMGWNSVTPQNTSLTMWENLDTKPYFYFVHSFFPTAEEEAYVACTTTYGTQTFHSAVTKGKLIATQFHPEKSQHTGLQLLKNFLAL